MRLLVSVRPEGFPVWDVRSPDLVVGSYVEPLCEMLSYGDHQVMVHDPFDLIDDRSLLGRCSVVRSRVPLISLLHVLAQCDGAMLLGYPAMWGAEKGALPREGMGKVSALWVNGRRVGPLGLDAMSCSFLGVPVMMVAGDDFLCHEAEALFEGPRPVTCEIKSSLGADSFVALAGGAGALMDGAKMSLLGVADGTLPSVGRLEGDVLVRISLSSPSLADAVSLIPSSRRTGPMDVSFTAQDPFEMRRFVATALSLIGG